MSIFRHIFGRTGPPASSEQRRLLVEVVADRGRLEQDLAAGREAVRSELAAAGAAIHDDLMQARAALVEQIDAAAREVAKLGREQLQAATVLEGQGEQIDGQTEQINELVGFWREHLSLRERELADQRQLLAERDARLRLDLIQHIIPVADALAESGRSARELIASLQGEGARRDETVSARGAFHLIAHVRSAVAAAGRAVPGSPQVSRLSPRVSEELEAWLDGLLLTERRLLALLDREDVRPIPSVGQRFDPRRHLAVGVERSADAADGTVVSETLRGYIHGDRVLRPAEVIVARVGAGDPSPATRAFPLTEGERQGPERIDGGTGPRPHGLRMEA